MSIAAADLQNANAALSKLISTPLLVTTSRYLCLSSLAKPTTAPDGSALPVPTICDELDTGNRWYWDGLLWHNLGQPDLLLADIVKAVNAAAAALQQQLAAEFLTMKQTMASGQVVETQNPTFGV